MRAPCRHRRQGEQGIAAIGKGRGGILPQEGFKKGPGFAPANEQNAQERKLCVFENQWF